VTATVCRGTIHVMPATTTPTATRRWTGGRIAAVVVATAAGLLATGFLAAGGFLLWGDAQTDRDGYLETAREPFSTTSYALATENLDIDLDGLGGVLGQDDLGKVRLEVQPRADKPVFVGIARTTAVSRYLSGTPHASVTDVRTAPFRASYRDRPGERRPARPADQRFWAASAHGAGTQALTWDVEDGDWSVVVMNEDGSRSVDTAVSAGAKLPFLATAGWVSIGAGLLLLSIAGAATVLVVRRPRAMAPAHPAVA
jgi:hypothetical protein